MVPCPSAVAHPVVGDAFSRRCWWSRSVVIDPRPHRLATTPTHSSSAGTSRPVHAWPVMLASTGRALLSRAARDGVWAEEFPAFLGQSFSLDGRARPTGIAVPGSGRGALLASRAGSFVPAGRGLESPGTAVGDDASHLEGTGRERGGRVGMCRCAVRPTPGNAEQGGGRIC